MTEKEELTNKVARFAEWLEARARRQEIEFKVKGWDNVTLEARRIKQKFDAVFGERRAQ